MATQPKLRAVPNIVTDLLALIDALAVLRSQVSALVPDNDGVDLAIAKDGIAFDLTIKLKASADPGRAVFSLEAQPIEGVGFSRVEAKPAPRAAHRKIITARVVSPEQIT